MDAYSLQLVWRGARTRRFALLLGREHSDQDGEGHRERERDEEYIAPGGGRR